MIVKSILRRSVVSLVIVGLVPSTFLPAHAFTGGVTTVYTLPSPDRVERARTFPAKTPELDQTYQRTMRTAATKAATGLALRKAVRSFVDKIPLIGALAILAIDLFGIWTKKADNTNDLMIPSSTACEVGPCYQYKYTSNGGAGGAYTAPEWSTTPESAVKSTISLMPTYDGKFSYRFGACNGADMYSCYHKLTTRSYINEGSSNQTSDYADSNVGGTLAKRSVEPAPADPNGPKRPVTDAELEDLLKADKPFLPILKQLDDAGFPVPFPDVEVEDMPQPIVISPSTTTHPDGSKTIERTTLEPYRAPDNSVQWRKTTETSQVSKPDANGQTTTTTEKTTVDKGQQSTPEKAPEAPATDSALPDQPKLYTKKYPDGMTGVWRDQRSAMANSPLFTLPRMLMPSSVGSAGLCPVMNVNLTFSQWANFGTKDVAPPCYVWDWGKAICIVSACLLARRLIFGG